MQSRTCPKCGTKIGGEHHVAAEGQTRLSPGQVQNVITNSDKRGYIMESGSLDQSKSVREMTTSSYRILHLFIHALIAVSPFSQTFLKNISDPIAHCMDHVNKDWDVLKTTLNCNDEDLALILHDILHSMSEDKQFSTPTLSTTQARMTWEGRFTTRYVNNRARNPAAASMDMRSKLQKAKDERKKKTTVFEAEINETLVFDDSYSAKRLPKLWRRIKNASLADFRVFYLNNETYCKHFPFISIYFKYEKLIPHLKHIYHLVKFSRILSMRLNYRIKRNDALNMTFRKFIAEHGELQHSLKAAFDNFAESWNAMMPLIERYQCHDLPTNKPRMNLDCQIVFGLVEGKDAGLFLCAALEYLVDIQNRFLRDVMSIKPGTCHSLKFIENQKGSDTNNPYLIKSVRLEDARQTNLIDYEWNPKLLKYSQCLLDVGKGKELIYDLYKIEEELVKDLVFNKTYLEPCEPGGLILEPFYYCMEMFQCSTTILYDIKQKIKQESIPQNMLALLIGGISSNYPSEFSSSAGNVEIILSGNESELLSALELLLCFVKRTAGSDGNITLKNYIQHWVKLSVLTENKALEKVLNTGLQLKHVVALYEIVEGKVADIMIESITIKYKASLTREIEKEIVASCSFDEKDIKLNANLITAEAFMNALKRFMFRQLLVETIREDHPLSEYLNQTALCCWPDNMDEDSISDMFPMSLLIKHTYEAYHFVKRRVEVILR
ncbi:2929_t:CDS:1 [Racocetra fulgida]|uniref:2929_t:CDS:1 n=1 Tax=Racocetra fulgida TaxID=60492 RepID=A0A9N8YV70_9GLOM|nr:2929_t:CDS:1 [Racocetra fulgida]